MTQGYGMTETTLGVCMSIMDQGRVGSVGKLVPGMCAKVCNILMCLKNIQNVFCILFVI